MRQTSIRSCWPSTANAKVSGAQHDLSFSLVADTSLNGAAFKHRMRLLAGSQWQLTDVK